MPRLSQSAALVAPARSPRAPSNRGSEAVDWEHPHGPFACPGCAYAYSDEPGRRPLVLLPCGHSGCDTCHGPSKGVSRCSVCRGVVTRQVVNVNHLELLRQAQHTIEGKEVRTLSTLVLDVVCNTKGGSEAVGGSARQLQWWDLTTGCLLRVAPVPHDPQALTSTQVHPSDQAAQQQASQSEGGVTEDLRLTEDGTQLLGLGSQCVWRVNVASGHTVAESALPPGHHMAHMFSQDGYTISLVSRTFKGVAISTHGIQNGRETATVPIQGGFDRVQGGADRVQGGAKPVQGGVDCVQGGFDLFDHHFLRVVPAAALGVEGQAGVLLVVLPQSGQIRAHDMQTGKLLHDVALQKWNTKDAKSDSEWLFESGCVLLRQWHSLLRQPGSHSDDDDDRGSGGGGQAGGHAAGESEEGRDGVVPAATQGRPVSCGVAHESTSVRVWDLKSGKQVLNCSVDLPPTLGPGQWLAVWQGAKRQFLTLADWPIIRVWDTSCHEVKAVLHHDSPGSWFVTMAAAPGPSPLLAVFHAADDGVSCDLWDVLGGGRLIARWQLPFEPEKPFFSEDGSRLVVPSWEGDWVWVFEVQGGRVLRIPITSGLKHINNPPGSQHPGSAYEDDEYEEEEDEEEDVGDGVMDSMASVSIRHALLCSEPIVLGPDERRLGRRRPWQTYSNSVHPAPVDHATAAWRID